MSIYNHSLKLSFSLSLSLYLSLSIYLSIFLSLPLSLSLSLSLCHRLFFCLCLYISKLSNPFVSFFLTFSKSVFFPKLFLLIGWNKNIFEFFALPCREVCGRDGGEWNYPDLSSASFLPFPNQPHTHTHTHTHTYIDMYTLSNTYTQRHIYNHFQR